MAINMRGQLTKTIEYLTEKDERVVTLLNDIGVFAFRNVKEKYSNRIYNLGILEQSSISIAAGLSMYGYIPFFHTIAPFVVERCYEQLKDDFGYQNINGNFVSVGASYDYSALGMTHYAPADIGALMQIPNMQIIIPGTANEMHKLICSEYANGKPTYFRLSENANKKDFDVNFAKAMIVKKGNKGTIVAVGPMLDKVLPIALQLDLTILYYTTVKPFDYETLVQTTINKNILLCEPYYYGGLTNEVLKAFNGRNVNIAFLGIPHDIINSYGTVEEVERDIGFTSENIRQKIKNVLEMNING